MSKIPRFRPSLSFRATIGILKKTLFSSLNNGALCGVRPFEEAFAGYIGVRNAISVPSGRMGLYLILKNLGLAKSSKIILPAFTYWAVPRIVSCLEFEPVFVDIDLATCNIDAAQIEQCITQDSKVIIPTHLYGLPCRMDTVLAIAQKYNLIVVEDCVQACGARYQGRSVGSFGEAAYFAFGITKNLTLLGGGIVATNNDTLAKKIRAEISSYGFVHKSRIVRKAVEALVLEIFSHPDVFSFVSFPFMYVSSLLGADPAGRAFEERERQFEGLPESYFKLMPPVLQAPTGLEQLRRLDSCNDKRIKNASYLLKNLKGIAGISLPAHPDGATKNIFTNFPIRSKTRDLVARELLKKGIDTSFGYMKAQHASCPNAIALEQSILHLPVYPSLSFEDLAYICQALKEIAQKAYVCN